MRYIQWRLGFATRQHRVPRLRSGITPERYTTGYRYRGLAIRLTPQNVTATACVPPNDIIIKLSWQLLLAVTVLASRKWSNGCNIGDVTWVITGLTRPSMPSRFNLIAIAMIVARIRFILLSKTPAIVVIIVAETYRDNAPGTIATIQLSWPRMFPKSVPGSNDDYYYLRLRPPSSMRPPDPTFSGNDVAFDPVWPA